MKSYVFLADGFEEIEAIAPVDIMRRAGMDVKFVSITDNKEVTGANGVSVKADITLEEVEPVAEWLITPGGMPGAENLHNCKRVCELLLAQRKSGGRIASICASPGVVLAPLGLLNGLKATCYPGFEPACEKGGAVMVNASVVTDTNLITANGPGAAMKFGYTIVAESMGEDLAKELASAMQYKG